MGETTCSLETRYRVTALATLISYIYLSIFFVTSWLVKRSATTYQFYSLNQISKPTTRAMKADKYKREWTATINTVETARQAPNLISRIQSSSWAAKRQYKTSATETTYASEYYDKAIATWNYSLELQSSCHYLNSRYASWLCCFVKPYKLLMLCQTTRLLTKQISNF